MGGEGVLVFKLFQKFIKYLSSIGHLCSPIYPIEIPLEYDYEFNITPIKKEPRFFKLTQSIGDIGISLIK